MKFFKKSISLLLAMIMLVSVFAVPISVSAHSYASDWRYWSQGGSDNSLMRSYGCWVVAQSKMLVDTGIETSPSFNPDVYMNWEYNNGFLDSGFYQTNGAQAPVTYAQQKGKALTYLGAPSSTDAQLWSNINNGYYTIVHVGGHYVYMDNEKSKATGVLYCMESWTTTGSVGSVALNSYYPSRGVAYTYQYTKPPTDTIPPKVEVRFLDFDSTGYTLRFTTTDNVGLSKISIATWRNGTEQKWQEHALSGTGWETNIRINYSDFGYAQDGYINVVWVYDTAGNIGDSGYLYPDNYKKYNEVDSIGYNSNKYVLYSMITDWDNAKEICEQLGGHLATIKDENEWKAVSKLITSNKMHSWLGAESTGGAWMWIDETPFKYNAWAPGQPDNNAGTERYLQVWSDSNTWNDANVYPTDIRGFVCEFENSNKPEKVASIKYNNNEYILYSQVTDWDYAKKKCEELGGHLATIKDEKEWNAVKELVESKMMTSWLGAESTSGTWKWIDGTPFNYTVWGDNQPDCSNKSEFYLEVWGDTLTWNDCSVSPFGSLKGFVCEIEGKELTTPSSNPSTNTEPSEKPTTPSSNPTVNTEPTEKPVGTTKRIYFSNNNNWDEVNCYYWAEFDTTMTQWPGETANHLATGVDGTKYYYIDIPSDVEYVIWNSGIGQTEDIKMDDTNNYYSLSDINDKGKYTVECSIWKDSIINDNPTVNTEPTEKPTVNTELSGLAKTMYFANVHNWDDVYCYYWSDSNDSMCEWPGYKAIYYLKDNGIKYYAYNVPIEADYIIWSNGTNRQTVDISYGDSNAFVPTCLTNNLYSNYLYEVKKGNSYSDSELIKFADEVINSTKHNTTTVRAKKATYFANGYSGDTVCKDCGKLISKGKSVTKLKLKTPKVNYKGGKRKITVKYNKVSGATGFQIKYKIGSKATTKTYNTKKTVSKTISKLKKGSYKFYVRAFVKSGSKVAYSSWTKAKSYKVK